MQNQSSLETSEICSSLNPLHERRNSKLSNVRVFIRRLSGARRGSDAFINNNNSPKSPMSPADIDRILEEKEKELDGLVRSLEGFIF